MENKIKNKFWILLIAIFITQLYLVSSLTISSVNTNPNEVQPGEKFSLDLKIENNLEDDVENVVVSLNLNAVISPTTGQVISSAPPFAPYQSSSEVIIEDINGEDDEKASFDLIAFSDAVSGTYNIPIQVSYKLNNGTKVPSESLGVVSVIVNAKPQIDVSSEGGVLIKGTNGKISIKIVNSGLGNAKFLSISLNQISGMRITGSNKVYIGNIDSNDFDTADFNVFVNADAPSLINLPVQLTYTDSRNNEITENKIVSINTYTTKEATDLGLIGRNNTFVIILSVVGVLVLFLIYRRIRKKNKSKRNGQ
jgi:hypothetical protein